MYLTISSSALSSRLQVVGKAIAPKNPLAILERILFKVQGNKLSLTASDSDTSVYTELDLIDSDGDFAFAAPTGLIAALKEISDQPVNIEFAPDSLALDLHYRNGDLSFKTEDASQYPVRKSMDAPTGQITLSANSLLKSLQSTLFACGEDELRPVMMGVLMDITNQNVTFVATDSHKMAKLTNQSARNEQMEDGQHALMVFRKKPLALVKAALAKGEQPVQIEFDNNQCRISFEDYVISSRLIEGRYPNYDRVIPRSNPYAVWVDRLSMLNAIKRITLCADASIDLVKLEIENNTILLSAQNSFLSTSGQESVPCQYGDAKIVIGFKASYLSEVLNAITTDEVIIKLADATRAGLFLPSENAPGEDLEMLLMPMMIKA